MECSSYNYLRFPPTRQFLNNGYLQSYKNNNYGKTHTRLTAHLQYEE